MEKALSRGRRGATAAVLLVGGGAIAAATWISGDHGFAIGVMVFYVVAAVIAWLWSGGQGDIAAIMRVGGDERQRSLDRDATTIAGYAMVFAAITGAVVQIARGRRPRCLWRDVRRRRRELRVGSTRPRSPAMTEPRRR